MKTAYSFSILLISAFCLVPGCAPDSPDSSTPAPSARASAPPARIGERNGVSENEILLGSSAALSGTASFLGTQLTAGSMAYFKDVNKNGGVHGRKINLRILNDRYEPERTLENTRKLIDEVGVFALFDYVGTPTTRSIIRLINQRRVPVLGLFTGAEFLRSPLQPYVFNVRASYFNEVEAIVDRWVAADRRKVAVFLQNDAFGGAVLTGTELALARHKLRVHATARFERGQLPEEEVVRELAATRPDAVVMVGTAAPLAEFVRQAKAAGLSDTPFHTVSFVGSTAFAQELARAGAGTGDNVFVTQVVPSPFDAGLSVVQEFTESMGRHYPGVPPNYVALEGFINAKILVEALQRTGPDPTRAAFMRALEAMSDYDAGTGLPVGITPYSHGFFDRVYLSTLRDGKFQVVE